VWSPTNSSCVAARRLCIRSLWMSPSERWLTDQSQLRPLCHYAISDLVHPRIGCTCTAAESLRQNSKLSSISQKVRLVSLGKWRQSADCYCPRLLPTVHVLLHATTGDEVSTSAAHTPALTPTRAGDQCGVSARVRLLVGPRAHVPGHSVSCGISCRANLSCWCAWRVSRSCRIVLCLADWKRPVPVSGKYGVPHTTLPR